MQEARQEFPCSVCGAVKAREDMFGAAPDLLCESCADVVRRRTAQTPTGRLVNTIMSGRATVTVCVIGAAAVLFVLGKLWAHSPFEWTQWINLLTTTGRTAEGELLATAQTQPWRLLTSAFLHAGFLHILFNAWWIWDLGRAIEFRRGSPVLALLVIGSAVAASGAQWMFTGCTAQGIPIWPGAVGLSGVVYALAGFLFAQRKVDPLAAAIMNTQTTRLLVAWLVLCVVLTEMNVLPIGNWAHGMGAAWGLAAGFGAQGRFRYVWLALLGLATAGLVTLVVSGVGFW